MVWQSPDVAEQKRQSWRRSAAVWGLFALLLAGAAGLQWRGGVAVTLGDRVAAGELSVRPPAEWQVATDRGMPMVLATATGSQSGGETRRDLAVMVLPGPEVADVFRRRYGTAFDGTFDGTFDGERATVAGRAGTLVEFARAPAGFTDGATGLAYAVAAAALGDGRVVVVELVRSGRLDRASLGPDAALVRRVAAEVRVGDAR